MAMKQYGLSDRLEPVPEVTSLFEAGSSLSCLSQVESLLGKPLSTSMMVTSLIDPFLEFSEVVEL